MAPCPRRLVPALDFLLSLVVLGLTAECMAGISLDKDVMKRAHWTKAVLRQDHAGQEVAPGVFATFSGDIYLSVSGLHSNLHIESSSEGNEGTYIEETSTTSEFNDDSCDSADKQGDEDYSYDSPGIYGASGIGLTRDKMCASYRSKGFMYAMISIGFVFALIKVIAALMVLRYLSHRAMKVSLTCSFFTWLAPFIAWGYYTVNLMPVEEVDVDSLFATITFEHGPGVICALAATICSLIAMIMHVVGALASYDGNTTRLLRDVRRSLSFGQQRNAAARAADKEADGIEVHAGGVELRGNPEVV